MCGWSSCRSHRVTAQKTSATAGVFVSARRYVANALRPGHPRASRYSIEYVRLFRWYVGLHLPAADRSATQARRGTEAAEAGRGDLPGVTSEAARGRGARDGPPQPRRECLAELTPSPWLRNGCSSPDPCLPPHARHNERSIHDAQSHRVMPLRGIARSRHRPGSRSGSVGRHPGQYRPGGWNAAGNRASP